MLFTFLRIERHLNINSRGDMRMSMIITLQELFTMGASINFITNCSNELQCIPTDFNSFQKCAYKLTMICTQFQATIEPNLGPEFPIATGKIQS
jgi:hypothetical protein